MAPDPKMTLRPNTDVDPMGQFTRFVNHELRQPITALRANLELGEIQAESENARRRFSSALKQVDRLTSLLQAITDLAEAESLKPSSERTDLAAVAHEARELFGPLFADAGCHFHVHEGCIWIGAPAKSVRLAFTRTIDLCFALHEPSSTLRIEVSQSGSHALLRIRLAGQYSESCGEVLDLFGDTSTLEKLQLRAATSMWKALGADLKVTVTPVEKMLAISLPLLPS
ncbi:MAG: hypothetical protein LAO06_05785 [Acidobacteriia bacterium]|nr:hypothetical protein [Terriglobia bacterium]